MSESSGPITFFAIVFGCLFCYFIGRLAGGCEDKRRKDKRDGCKK